MARDCVSNGVGLSLCGPTSPTQLESTTLSETAANEFGRLDVVVHAAAVPAFATFRDLELSSRAVKEAVAVNCESLAELLSACVTQLEDHGRVVSISSVAAGVGFYGEASMQRPKLRTRRSFG